MADNVQTFIETARFFAKAPPPKSRGVAVITTSGGFGVLSAVALLMTVGVYGVVALIVKMDDAGIWLIRRAGPGMGGVMQQALGETLLAVAPRMLKLLAVVGTLAMFLVGGGIVVHGIPVLAAASHQIADAIRSALPGAGILAAVSAPLFDGFVGILTGLGVLSGVLAGSRIVRRPRSTHA
jgi:predicted DNA repair protein MutK